MFRINLSRFRIAAGGADADDDKASAEEERRREIEAMRGQVSDVKNRWKTGAVEAAEQHESEARNELEALRGQKLADRFREGAEPAEHEVVRAYDRSELDTASGF